MNTILATFAVLVSVWAWVSARNAKDGVAKVLRLLNARVGKLVDEAEGKRPWQGLNAEIVRRANEGGFPAAVPFDRPHGAVEEAAPAADGGEPLADARPGRAAPPPRPSECDSTVEETPGNRGSLPLGREPLDEGHGLGGRAPASPRPPHGGGKQGPSQQTRELATKAKEILARRGDVAPVDLRDELGLTIKGFAKVRALLNADPDVITYGQTKNRRYKLRAGAPTNGRRQQIAAEATPDGRSPKMPTTPGAKKGRQQPTVDGRILSAVQLMPKSARTLSDDLDIPLETVVQTLHALEADGDVRRHDSGNWVLVP